MKTFAQRLFLISIVLMLTASIARNQVSTTRDGNWWIEESQPAKLTYITGFFDGMDLGNDFSYWGYVDEYKAKDHDAAIAMAKTTASFDEFSSKYLTNVTNGQLVSGLDKFYADYRNRRIKTQKGVWLVLNSIAGKSDTDMEKLIENYRKNAVK
jgi:hypothetical protein